MNVADEDQFQAASDDQATMLWSYFCVLLKKGFTRAEALSLVNTLYAGMVRKGSSK